MHCCFHRSIVSPRTVHELVLVIFLKLLVLLLLLVVIGQHSLVGICIYGRFSLRGARATGLKLRYELLFLICTEVVFE